jgi:hypothetical protein
MLAVVALGDWEDGSEALLLFMLFYFVLVFGGTGV